MVNLLQSFREAVERPLRHAAQRRRAGQRRRGRRSSGICRQGEALESRQLLAVVPFGAQADDTALYMVGDVNVNVVFLESSGALDPSTEDWTEAHKQEVKQNIIDGLQWWEEVYDAQGVTADLNFHIDFTHADTPAPTRYEPISRISNDYTLWVDEFLTYAGHQSSASLASDIRAFNHAGRLANETHWSFTIFVVNSENDEALNGEGRFAPGGSHSRAFAFAGGLFFVMPSTRPASAVAHETGHMFYAYDEYSGAASYYAHRGYLNVQNTNGLTSHPNPATRQTSIMDVHELAYPLGAVSDSAREMIGWRDSDGNGILDVLDVPHTLSGVGSYDPTSETYRFTGSSSVNALPNLNTWDQSLQSDVTLNRLSRLEYRLDGGPWLTAATLDSYSASLDVAIANVPAQTGQIELRTIDDYTGVTSPVFVGTPAQPAATPVQGVSGFVWHDENANGVWDQGEPALEGWSIDVLDAAGQPIEAPRGIEADDYAHNEVINHAIAEATLSAVGFGVWEDTVRSRDRDGGQPGERVYKHFIGSGWSSSWTYGNGIPQHNRQLRIDFSQPVTTVSIDAIANSDNDYGRLEIYDAQNNLLARYTTAELAANQIETMTLGVDSPRIAYALASGHANTGVDLDNLRFGAETTATTAAAGNYAARSLPPGEYRLRAQARPGYAFTTTAEQGVTLASGAAISGVNFGVRTLPPAWQNQENPLDVDRSGLVTLSDALTIIAELRRRGVHPLEGEPSSGTEPLIDVNGDGMLTLSDALQVIQHMRQALSGGEAEMAALLSEGEGEQVLFRLEATNLSGTPISTIDAGEQFLLKVYVQDLRPATFPDRGINVAFLDIIYDASPVAPVTTGQGASFPIDITFAPEFQHTPDVVGISPGLIDDIGALQTNPGLAEPLGAGEVLLLTIRFNAVAGGNVTFQADDADEPGNDVRFWEPPDPPVDPTLVSYGTTSLTVLQPLQANNDSFQVATGSSANSLNVRQNDVSPGNFTVSSLGATANGGTATIAAGGTHVNYTPPAGFTGFDAFDYTIRAGSATSTARVQVTVGSPAPPYRNPLDARDVDGSGSVTLNDALLVVSNLRTHGVRALVLPPPPGGGPPPYLDVSGDNTISIGDALQVVSHLRNLLSSGEAELAHGMQGDGPAGRSASSAQAAHSDALDAALADVAEACDRQSLLSASLLSLLAEGERQSGD